MSSAQMMGNDYGLWEGTVTLVLYRPLYAWCFSGPGPAAASRSYDDMVCRVKVDNTIHWAQFNDGRIQSKHVSSGISKRICEPHRIRKECFTRSCIVELGRLKCSTQEVRRSKKSPSPCTLAQLVLTVSICSPACMRVGLKIWLERARRAARWTFEGLRELLRQSVLFGATSSERCAAS